MLLVEEEGHGEGVCRAQDDREEGEVERGSHRADEEHVVGEQLGEIAQADVLRGLEGVPLRQAHADDGDYREEGVEYQAQDGRREEQIGRNDAP